VPTDLGLHPSSARARGSAFDRGRENNIAFGNWGRDSFDFKGWNDSSLELIRE
jgi:hypothetical protein